MGPLSYRQTSAENRQGIAVLSFSKLLRSGGYLSYVLDRFAGRIWLAKEPAFSYQTKCSSVPPWVVVREKPHQIRRRLLAQILRHRTLRPLPLNPINPPMFLVPALRLGLVAGVLVVPVDDEDAAVGGPAEVDGAEVLVAGDQEVRGLVGHERRALPLQHVPLDRAAVDAAEDHAGAVFLG